MKNGFIKVAAALPKMKVADPEHNAKELIRLTKMADREEVGVVVFPELSLSGATCADLFGQETLLSAVKDALALYLRETAMTASLCLVGMPLAIGGKLYNCAAFCQSGKLLGITPKTHFSDSCDELRNFTAFHGKTVLLSLGKPFGDVPFGTDLLLKCVEMPTLTVAAEIGTDLWLASPPSSRHTAAGATLICNPCATPEAIGVSDYRRMLVQTQSAKTNCAYLLSDCGEGESTTDLVFAGHGLIAENGALLAERQPFDSMTELLISEVDAERLLSLRRRQNGSDPLCAETYVRIPFSLPVRETKLTRFVDSHPFVPSGKVERVRRCEAILNIQSRGLKQRVECSYAKKLVIGISGGLDSTLALLVSVRAMDELNRPRTDVIAVTMPCFGTTKRTKSNATVLCEELGVDFRCVDIRKSVLQHFRDIGHDPEDRNVTYENAQARERTQVLMDIANDCGGLVVGTGDLSELALGWATYNGDHMSMYGVNASVPKTLIRHIVAFSADLCDEKGEKKLAAALRDVLNTPVSPELLPADGNGEIAQKTEDLVGPYELHDFYLYYLVRFGFSPEKLYRLAKYALGDVYSDETLKKWLKVFLRRFFTQQFKRSCMPDGPKVGSVDLSPRGEWKMPSDASAAAWLAEAEKL